MEIEPAVHLALENFARGEFMDGLQLYKYPHIQDPHKPSLYPYITYVVSCIPYWHA